ncbi:MAG TPA: hypothetical protein VMI75_20545 [Polyangiaceae bacterium]|nr:hypothetical protein [Polyangiaceae bacterium]
MKRIGLAVLVMMLTATGAWAFGVKDVIALQHDGVADSLIVQKIEYSGTTFHLDASDLRALKQAGVSDNVISVMLKTEGTDSSVSYVEPWWPAYPYYSFVGPYPPAFYAPYRRPVFVGLNVGFRGRFGRGRW